MKDLVICKDKTEEIVCRLVVSEDGILHIYAQDGYSMYEVEDIEEQKKEKPKGKIIYIEDYLKK